MSTWDSVIFNEDAVTELFEEVDGLEGDDRAEALLDACKLAVGDATAEEERAGLGAATVAAIWCGAPFSAGEIVNDNPFIREGIGACPEELREAASEVFDALIDGLSDEDQEAVEDFAEAVS